jgi:hypothetical protein
VRVDHRTRHDGYHRAGGRLSPRRSKRLLVGLVATFLTGCFDSPLWRFDRYEVHGQFKADGSCTAFLDDSTMIPEFLGFADSTDYMRDYAMNVGLGLGDDLQSISCGMKVHLNFRGRKGEVLRPGRYVVREDWPPAKDDASASADARQVTAGAWPFAISGVGLNGVSGEVILTRVDTGRVIGNYQFTARRRWKM